MAGNFNMWFGGNCECDRLLHAGPKCDDWLNRSFIVIRPLMVDVDEPLIRLTYKLDCTWSFPLSVVSLNDFDR